MRPYLHALLMFSLITLVGFAFTLFSLAKSRARTKRLDSRVATMLEPHLRTSGRDRERALRLGTRVPVGNIQQRCAKLIGYDGLRKEHHPIPWQVAVGGALLPAYIAERVASSYIGPSGWVIFAVTWVFSCRKFFSWSDKRLASTLYRQFPDALAMIVRSVRVGIPVSEAVRIVGRESAYPTSLEFVRVGHELSVGVPLERTLRDLADRSGLPEYRFFATALSLQSQTGGALGETLDSLADTIRKRVAARARGKALAAEARASALVLTGLPVAVGSLLFFINPSYMLILFSDRTGERMLGLAVGLLMTGTFVMRNMIRKSLS